MWKTVKLGDVCTIYNGGTPKSKTKSYWEGDIKWLTPKDMGKLDGKFVSDTARKITHDGLNNSSAKLVPANSVILSCRAPIGHVFINECDMSFNQGCKGLIPSNEILVEYLYYFLFSSKQLLNDLGKGTTFKEISSKTLSNVSFAYPPLAEQERIVAKLDAAFAEIDEAINAAVAKENEVQKLKASLLSSSFSGDAVMWKTMKLGDICQIQPKKAQVKARLKDRDEVSFMPMKDLGIQSMYPISTQIKKLERVYNSYTYFEDNDILLAKITPCFENGKLGIASNLVNGVGFGSSEYIVLRCSEKVIPQFIYFCLNQSSFRTSGKNQMSGAVGHKRVPKEYIENYKIYLPPLLDQERIVAKLDAADSEFRNVNESIAISKANYLALKSAILAQELKLSEAA